jgi:peptide-methionine (S)-S-oxide reductase
VLALLLLASCAPSSGLSGGGVRVRSIVRRAAPAPRMSILERLPSITTVLYGAMGATAANGLVQKVPKLLGGRLAGGQLGDVAIDAILFTLAGVSLAKGAGIIGQVDYAKLDGREVDSLACEAGEWALAGVVPTVDKEGRYEVATFAGGCFWGTELHYQRVPGVIATAVGYTQGRVVKPTYEQVCSGSSGHTEGIQLLFDPAVCSYESLCEKLLSTIDPTARNRVGNDAGTQYRHGIYTHTDAQRESARRVLERAQREHERPIVTELRDAGVFYPAESYHQRYLQKGGQSAAKNAPEKVRCYG